MGHGVDPKSNTLTPSTTPRRERRHARLERRSRRLLPRENLNPSLLAQSRPNRQTLLKASPNNSFGLRRGRQAPPQSTVAGDLRNLTALARWNLTTWL